MLFKAKQSKGKQSKGKQRKEKESKAKERKAKHGPASHAHMPRHADPRKRASDLSDRQNTPSSWSGKVTHHADSC